MSALPADIIKSAMQAKVRYPVVAGSFYSADPKELREQIQRFLNQAPVKHVPGELKALIVPHAGYIYSGRIAAVGYKLLQTCERANLQTVLLLGPAHFVRFPGAATLRVDYWQTPLGQVPSSNLIETIMPSPLLQNLPNAHQMEHSLEVQLPFLQSALKEFSILPIVTGDVKYQELALFLLKYIEKFDLIVVSSDLSHYYAYEQAIELDSIAHQAITSLDLEKMEKMAEACGKTAILTLMQLAKELKWDSILLDYCNSGDTAGDKGSVVGYGCYAFYR